MEVEETERKDHIMFFIYYLASIFSFNCFLFVSRGQKQLFTLQGIRGNLDYFFKIVKLLDE